uniref:Uncharacterized protein n=1 Tax=Timema genevievae TaxID=629358 RepID=A0A7R9PJU2_TIMGE|nr:unnamed protein product [Timema genevievae]
MTGRLEFESWPGVLKRETGRECGVAGFVRRNKKPQGRLGGPRRATTVADANLDPYHGVGWYAVDRSKLPEPVLSRFLQLSPDHETEQFLEEAVHKSDWVFTQLWHSVARSFLGFFMTQTSINGSAGKPTIDYGSGQLAAANWAPRRLGARDTCPSPRQELTLTPDGELAFLSHTWRLTILPASVTERSKPLRSYSRDGLACCRQGDWASYLGRDTPRCPGRRPEDVVL